MFRLILAAIALSVLGACGGVPPQTQAEGADYDPQLNIGPAPVGTPAAYSLPDQMIFSGRKADFDRNMVAVLRSGIGCYNGYYAKGDVIYDADGVGGMTTLQRTMAGPNARAADDKLKAATARFMVTVRGVQCIRR